MSLRIPQTSSPGAAAGGAKKLLVVGLCGEAIKVEWLPEDTVGAVKDKAYSAAANTLLADGSRCSLVQGIAPDQLFLAFGDQEHEDSFRDEAQRLDECLGGVNPPLSESESALLTGCWVDAGRKLRLVSFATDLDRFVEIDFEDSARTTPRQVVGGKSGVSAANHQNDSFGCGVFLGRWRPNSQLKPDQRVQVAVKVMEKDVHRDVQHLTSMDCPFVNNFFGEAIHPPAICVSLHSSSLLNAPFPFRQFSTSRQLKVASVNKFTIMVSSYCQVGDHFGVICDPKCDEPSLLTLLSCTVNGRDCFCIVNSRTQPVKHSFSPRPTRDDRFKMPFICLCGGHDNRLDGCAIHRVDEIIDECYFTLRADRALSAVSFRGILYMHPAHPELLFDSSFALPEGTQAKCMFLSAGLNMDDGRNPKINFRLKAPRPNVAFVRAFALQMLRGLAYCHSLKRTFHEDVKCENIFHKNRITVDHLMCHRDGLQVMQDMKVEIGDFGRAEKIDFSVEEHNTTDFKRLAWVLLITVNPHVFMGPFKQYLGNPFWFAFPSKDAIQSPAKNALPPIRPSCSHFDTSGSNSGSIDEFMNLVCALSEWSPRHSKSAFKFADYLARTHPFFEPLNTTRSGRERVRLGSRSPSPQPACEGFDDRITSIDDQYGCFHPAPLSAFQHLLQHLSPENRNIAAKLWELLDTIQKSSLNELMQHTKYELFQTLLPLLQGAIIDSKCVFLMFQVAFQVMDLCCDMRHVLMQVSCGGPHPAQTSFLQFMSKCAVGDCQALHCLPELEAQSVQAKSRQHVINIVRKSIPYASLNYWAQSGGCYSEYKMRSMRTHKVVASIFGALFPDSKLSLSDEPGHSELLEFFVHLRAAITTADAATHASEHSAQALSLFREICAHATVEELQRNLLHE